MTRKAWGAITRWFDDHHLAMLVITAGAFVLQVFHLYWLLTAVILERLTGVSWFVFPSELTLVYVVADFLEVPALVSATVFYLASMRHGVRARSVVYVILLNTQWVHLFWITDNVVVQSFADNGMFAWNAWVAWVAILIDYLEVPVMIEMLKRVYDARGEIVGRARTRLVGT